MKTIKLLAITAFLTLALFSFTSSQDINTINEKEKSEIIKKTIGLLYEHYIYPERVKNIENFLTDKLQSGGYTGFIKPEDFLESLNSDLEREGNDHHLNIFFGPERVKQIQLDAQNERNGTVESFSEEWMQKLRYENFRLKKVERLDGNIGYFQFLNFSPLALAKESIIGAMNFLRYSSALIIDVRENGGGYAETMNFLLSYFLKDSLQTGEKRHRKGNRIEKTYIPTELSIKKIPDDVPVYILVGGKTSSAAEGLTYTMQQFKRAVVVGEQTKGEGNPGQLFVINEFLYTMIPTIESRNAVSGKGIDGIGVTPDIIINPKKAYEKALLEICQQLSASFPVPELRRAYEWQIPFWENKLNPVSLTETIVGSIVGEYAEGRKIIYENENVYYINMRGERVRLEYIGNGIFQNSEKSWLRLFMPYTDKPVNEFEWVWDDGGKEKVQRIGNVVK